MPLEYDALKYFYEQTRTIIEHKPVSVGAGHFYLLFRHNGSILFHAKSVVTLCHIAKPEQFAWVTQRSFREAFPRQQRIQYDRRNLLFRALEEEEFWEIVK